MRPSLLEVESELRMVKRVSWVLSISLTIFLIFFWPILNVFFGVFSLSAFKFWIVIGHIFVFISFFYCLLGPVVEHYYPNIVAFVQKFQFKLPKINDDFNNVTSNIKEQEMNIREDNTKNDNSPTF